MINNDILIYLLRFLDKDTLMNFNQAYPSFTQDIIKEKKRRFALSYNVNLKKIIGIQTLINAPILKFKKSFLSYNFIDRIRLSDIKGNKIMMGMDILGRNFLVLHDKKDFSIFIIYDKKKNDKNLNGFFTYYDKKNWINEYFLPEKEYTQEFLEKIKNFWERIKLQ